MNVTAKVTSLIALASTIVPSLLYFMGMIGHDVVKLAAIVGSLVWFLATPMWMGRELPIDATEVEI
jgi:hypothetical protein